MAKRGGFPGGMPGNMNNMEETATWQKEVDFPEAQCPEI